ncbi:hypothetical protein AQUCO_04000060v1 [Aquilegia coerulea]|uniref:Uncharacterized protein n=1 Tax=Aquilegia coerulea TaxID=218851 RepID=A0A2G5CR24_AQUCA|nr:hypothetical protein AQUCO_04000060v1 [Aquilegia coerulea]
MPPHVIYLQRHDHYYGRRLSCFYYYGRWSDKDEDKCMELNQKPFLTMFLKNGLCGLVNFRISKSKRRFL